MFIKQTVPLSVFLSVKKYGSEEHGLLCLFVEQVLKLKIMSHYTRVSDGMSSLVLYSILNIDCSYAISFSKYVPRKKYFPKFFFKKSAV